MADAFLDGGYSVTAASLSNGQSNLNINSLAIQNLSRNLPVLTDGNKNLISSILLQSQVQDLITDLASKVGNPLIADLNANGYNINNAANIVANPLQSNLNANSKNITGINNTGSVTLTLNGTDLNTRLTADETNISNLQTKTQNITTVIPSLTPFTGTISSNNLTVSSLSTAGYVKNSVAGVISTATAVPQADVTNLVSDLSLKAPLANPTFTGTMTAAATSITGTLTMNTQNIDLVKSISLPASNTVKMLNTTTGGAIVESTLAPISNDANFSNGRIVLAVSPLINNATITYLQNVSQYGRYITNGQYFDSTRSINNTLGTSISSAILSIPNGSGRIIGLPNTVGSSISYFSTDGITWASTATNVALTAIYQIVYSGTNWIANNSTGIYYSSDGITWTLGTTYLGILGVIALAGFTLVATTTTNIYTSINNGVTWSTTIQVSPQFTRYCFNTINNILLMVPSTGNTIYFQGAPYNNAWTTNTVGTGLITAVIFDSVRNTYGASLANTTLQIYTAFIASNVWIAGPISGATVQSTQGIFVVNPVNTNGVLIQTSGGPPTYIFTLFRSISISSLSGGYISPNLTFDTTANTITSTSGGITIAPLSGQNLQLTTVGVGTAGIQTANQIITLNPGTSKVNITGSLTSGTPKCVINLNGAGQTVALSVGVGRTVPLIVSSVISNQFTVTLATGVITYNGIDPIYFMVNFSWTATFDTNAGNNAYVSYAPNSTMVRSLVTTNGLNSSALMGGSYTGVIQLSTNNTLQLYMLAGGTNENLTFTGYQLSITSLLA